MNADETTRASLMEFRSSWLIQRLERPWPAAEGHPLFGKDNPFAFGGGLRNGGGLSGEAMDLLRDVWRFDYMGAAEFEFGAVPKALQSLAAAELTGFSFELPLAEVERNWRESSKKKPVGSVGIYVLCPSVWAQQVEERIREIARGGYRLKESTRLSGALNPADKFDREICGWLELDNGFLFFTDAAMWEKACALFGVEVGATV